MNPSKESEGLINALVLVNKVNDYLFTLYQAAVQMAAADGIKHITQVQGIVPFLQVKGMECDFVDVVVQEAVVKNKPFLSKIAYDDMFGSHCIPGTQLESWKVLMHDRFHQFMRFKDFDYLHDIVDAYNYDILIAPLDVNDHLSQYLMRDAYKRGTRSIGVQTDTLRTKENLDALYFFDKMIVQSESDKDFLVNRKEVKEDNIMVMDNQDLSRQLNNVQIKRSVLKTQFKQKYGLPNQNVINLYFSIRHIWECREWLQAMMTYQSQNMHRINVSDIRVTFETQLEEKEWPVLFKDEIAQLNIRSFRFGQPVLELLLASDQVIGFRINEVLEMAGSLGIPATLYDPCLYNRSDKLISWRSGVDLITDKPFPAAQWLEGPV